jgi:peptidoglycan/LPS O-acetylase OafA/YrhL
MSDPAVSRRHVPALDGVRGLAVLTVVVYHYGGGAQSPNRVLHAIGVLLQGGWCGVTLFFVLSGFLISGILWDGKGKAGWWRRFYWRRTLRIFPLYYAALILVFISGLVAGLRGGNLAHVGVLALYLQNIPSLVSRWPMDAFPLPTFHFWSLAVEEQFYLLWPFLLVRARTLHQARMLCSSVFLLSALFRFATWAFLVNGLSYSPTLPSHAGDLALGALLAMSYRDPVLWQRVARLAPITLLLGAAGFFATALVAHSFRPDTVPMYLYGMPSITIVFASLLALSLGEGLTARIFSVAWLRWLGGISYGVYVYHILLAPLYRFVTSAIAPHASRNEGLGLLFLVAVAMTLLVAQLSFRFFEQPILRLKDRFAA